MTYERSKLAIFAGLTACFGVHTQGVAEPVRETIASTSKRIAVEPDGVICVSVKTAQELWPKSQSEPEGAGLSNWLVNGLRRKFRENGKLGNSTRFRTNDNGADRACGIPSAVYIDLNYKNCSKGIICYKIEVKFHDNMVMIFGRKNIEEEVNSGRVRVYQGQSALKSVIYSDVLSRADEIFQNAIIAK